MKNCVICQINLNDKNFTWYRAKNYIWKCNSCTRHEKKIQARESRLKNPQKSLERTAKYREKLRANDPVSYTCKIMQSSSKKRANALGMAHNITKDYLVSIAPKTCPIFGWELKYGGGERAKHSPSLDRIDSSKGYEIGNVQIISFLANLMKNEANKKELLLFAKWILWSSK